MSFPSFLQRTGRSCLQHLREHLWLVFISFFGELSVAIVIPTRYCYAKTIFAQSHPRLANVCKHPHPALLVFYSTAVHRWHRCADAFVALVLYSLLRSFANTVPSILGVDPNVPKRRCRWA